MAGYRPYSYQYETSPRKLQPDYEVRGNNTVKKKKSTLNQHQLYLQYMGY